MDAILKGRRPAYEWDVDTSAEFIRQNGQFATGRGYIKTLLCLMASRRPLTFRDNGTVNISNDWLARSNSKNYHHFFPKSYLKSRGYDARDANHIVNITLVDDQLNKKEIRAKPPSEYIAKFAKENGELAKALATHFISIKTDGINDDDYDKFIRRRSKRLSRAIQKKIITDDE